MVQPHTSDHLQVSPGWLLVQALGSDRWRVAGCARRAPDGSPVAWRVGAVVVLAVEPGLLACGQRLARDADVVAVVVEAVEPGPAARVAASVERALSGQAASLDGALGPEGGRGGEAPGRSPVPPAGSLPLTPTDTTLPAVLPPSGKSKVIPPTHRSLLSWVTESQEGSLLRSELDRLSRDRGVAMWAARMRVTGEVSREAFCELRDRVLEMPLGPPLHERLHAASELGQAVEDQLAEE